MAYRQRDSSALGVVASLLALGIPLLILLWNLGHLWASVVFWLFGPFLLAMTIAGLQATFKPSEKKGKDVPTSDSLQEASQSSGLTE